ncbi:hypothetical protein H0E86_00785 [Streptomyces sp. SCSIO-PteL053]|nr:hypothetical protein H0E86_00785 [Streptomyces sp. SCSIO-PteL053]
MEAPVGAAAELSLADAQFWSAVEQEDFDGLTEALDIEGGDDARSALGAMLPALSSWRRRTRELSTVDDWRYEVAWRPLPDASAARLSGHWLVVVPETHAEDALTAGCLAALTDHGAQVLPVTVDGGKLRRDLFADHDLPADLGACCRSSSSTTRRTPNCRTCHGATQPPSRCCRRSARPECPRRSGAPRAARCRWDPPTPSPDPSRPWPGAWGASPRSNTPTAGVG